MSVYAADEFIESAHCASGVPPKNKFILLRSEVFITVTVILFICKCVYEVKLIISIIIITKNCYKLLIALRVKTTILPQKELPAVSANTCSGDNVAPISLV